MGIGLVDILDRALQLVLRAACSIMRELRLVGADEVRGRIDDCLIEFEERGGQPLRLRVELSTSQSDDSP